MSSGATTTVAVPPKLRPSQRTAASAKDDHFFWLYTEEPHRTRRLKIIKAHPEVRLCYQRRGPVRANSVDPGHQALWARTVNQMGGARSRDVTAGMCDLSTKYTHRFPTIPSDSLHHRCNRQSKPVSGDP